MISGYKLSNGNDLSTIFAERTSAPLVVTGYTISNGNDLSSLFEPGHTYKSFAPTAPP